MLCLQGLWAEADNGIAEAELTQGIVVTFEYLQHEAGLYVHAERRASVLLEGHGVCQQHFHVVASADPTIADIRVVAGEASV